MRNRDLALGAVGFAGPPTLAALVIALMGGRSLVALCLVFMVGCALAIAGWAMEPEAATR